jgi:hypothetical protein
MSLSGDRSCSRARRLALGLLLLAVPACGLSDYERLMRESQEREKFFQDEQKYLGKPVEMPTHQVQTDKDKEAREEAVANVFFRPPKGIEAKPKPEPRNGRMWQYPADSRGSDFSYVEMAFAADDKDFADEVMKCYQASEQPTRSTHQFTPSGQDTPLLFDSWEFSNGQAGYSVNILRSNRPIAVVYIYNKARRDNALKAIEVSLQSLAVDQQVILARQRYNQKTPWKLATPPKG